MWSAIHGMRSCPSTCEGGFGREAPSQRLGPSTMRWPAMEWQAIAVTDYGTRCQFGSRIQNVISSPAGSLAIPSITLHPAAISCIAMTMDRWVGLDRR